MIYGVDSPCPVFPASRSMAWGRMSITDVSESTAPLGWPGRFRIRDRPRTPHTPRLRIANGGLRQALGAHLFRYALDQLRTHRPRRFRRDIALRDARPAGRHHQLDLFRQLNQGLFDVALVVRNNTLLRDLESMRLQRLQQSPALTSQPDRPVPPNRSRSTPQRSSLTFPWLPCARSLRSSRPTSAPASLRESRSPCPAPCTCHTPSEPQPTPQPAPPSRRR